MIKLKELVKREVLKESAPIGALAYSFLKTSDYKKAVKTWKKIESEY